jgi:hypothetical protein
MQIAQHVIVLCAFMGNNLSDAAGADDKNGLFQARTPLR